ncbi:glycerophosphodiester phosphodiesterase [Shouchella patagoniensis]|uniref:glycerophosphodiester phosphodiesterase n=1 Tax=Shouchella patagoniensis TaxID=228576 RepID=UPI001472941C|nr:glycerophosphodiester phosphodiesterase family protein [Shouchella patagoniensis]
MINAIAHRGYAAKYPENTHAAFAAAIELRFAVIELDVHLSFDGIPVVIHDFKVDRVTDGKGNVDQFTVAELKKLKVCGSERIPTLAEVFAWFGGQTRFAIELKNEGNRYPGIEETVLDVIQQFRLLNDVYVNSFNHHTIERMRELSSKIELGFIKRRPTAALFKKMHQLRITSLAMNYRFFSKRIVNQCKKEGIQLIVYGMDKERQMKRMLTYPDVRCTVKELETFIRLYKEKEQYR